MNLLNLLNPFTWFQDDKKAKKKVFLTKLQVLEAYELATEYEWSIDEIAKRYNISQPTAWKIKNGLHKHLQGKKQVDESEEEIVHEQIEPKKSRTIVVPTTTRIHLSRAEIIQIEDLYPNFDRNLIKSVYNIKESTLHKIIHGKHIRSSEPYKTMLMKKALK